MTISSKLKKLFMAAAGAAVIAVGIGQTAQATVLTFDELSPTSTTDGSLIPDGYGGFRWDNFYYLTSSTYYISKTGYQNGTVSGENVAYNGYGNISTVNDNVFDFNGAYLTAAWNNGLNIVVEGFLDGVPKYASMVMVNTNAPTFFNFNFLGIDRLQFISFGGTNADLGGMGTQFVMDDFEFHEVKSVPEPTLTLGVLAFGTFGVGFLLNKSKVKS